LIDEYQQEYEELIACSKFW